MDQAQQLRNIIKAGNTTYNRPLARIITVTSGKGGVGKSNTAINLAIQFRKEGKRVIILDADFGLANIEIMFGAVPKHNLSDLIYQGKSMKEIITWGPMEVGFISGGSGIAGLSNLGREHLNCIIKNLSELDTIADVVIIDEMSMVDIQLFQALLKAILPGTRLILVGDVDQLPSVGPGQVLRDLMNSRAFPMVTLEKIFRQAGQSDIVVNAHRINRGEQITLDNKSKDFFLLERNDVNVIYKHMIQLIQDMLPRYVGATSFDIQVLTPMRKGSLGCETLNEILQRYLNPADPHKKEHAYGNTVFREGDKVMQIKNNYQIEWEIVGRYNIPIDKGMGVFNGDMGRVKEINDTMSTLLVEFDDGRRVNYPFSALEELELSYAITIHKSQGSEYPVVILPLLGGPRMLFNRNLLYTGITRARNCVTILGSSETVRNMIENVSENRRYTGLEQRIREICCLPENDTP